MEKKNYNNMYKPKTLKEINDELTAPVEESAEVEPQVEEVEEAKDEVVEEKVEEVKEEIAVEEKKEEPIAKKASTGKVTGGLSLNVRKAPGGEIIKVLSNGESVTIKDDSNADWYEISSPVSGFVMKKFIQLS